MSLQPSLTSYIRTIPGKNVRNYAYAVGKPVAEVSKHPSEPSELFAPPEEVKTTKINGIPVATIETNRPISKLAVYFRAGTRYETHENQGIVHALRIATGLGTKGTSQFGITRHIQFAGGNLSCTAGREHFAYTLEASRDKIDKLQQIFLDVTTQQAFKRWELGDAVPRFKHELDTLTPEVRVLEMLHRAAFRRGVGNSLYSPRHMVGKHNGEMLSDYVKKNFVDASVVGVGLSLDSASHFAQSLGIVKGDNPALPSKFSGGGDIRKEIGGRLAYVALALEGGKLTNQKEAFAAAVAQRVLGTGPRTKRGLNAGGKLTTVNGTDNAATAFSASYTDTGMLGVLLIGHRDTIANATKKVAGLLREPNFTQDEVARGKAMLKADITNAFESPSELIEILGLETLLLGSPGSLKAYEQVIDSITPADLTNLIKKSGGKLSMAAMGNVGRVPYLDELD